MLRGNNIMKILYCASCVRSIGLNEESRDDRYWYATNPKYTHDEDDLVFCSKDEAIFWYGFRSNDKNAEKELGLKYGFVSEMQQAERESAWYEEDMRNSEPDVDIEDMRWSYAGY